MPNDQKNPQSIETLQQDNSKQSEKKAEKMPVLSNKFNEMIEHYNLIRSILEEPTIIMQKFRDLLGQINLNEDMNEITKEVTKKIIYYIIEVAYDEEEQLDYEKFSMLKNTLEEMTEILKGEHLNRRAELLRSWIRCTTHSDTFTPFFNRHQHITKTIIKETKRLIFETRQTEQIVPDLQGLDLDDDANFEDEEETRWQYL